MITAMGELFVHEKIVDPYIVTTDTVLFLSRLKVLSGTNLL